MKIVNRETFLELPPGTLFSKYRHCYMEALEIKGDSLRNDYCFQQIAEAIACTSSVQHTDLLDDMATAGLSVPVDLNCQGRDGWRASEHGAMSHCIRSAYISATIGSNAIPRASGPVVGSTSATGSTLLR